MIDDEWMFDPAELLAVESAQRVQGEEGKKARAVAIQTRKMLRRAKCEKVLDEILPAELQPNTSYHVISHGDVDALSYLRHIVKARALTYVSISTWCMAREDVEEVERWLDAGRIDRVDWYVGEIFPNQYGDEMELVRRLVACYGGRLVVARNHSKVTLAANEAEGFYAAIESSANVNTNPRIEQSAIHVSEDLYLFYRDFFDGLNSIEPRQPGRVRAPAQGIAAGD